MRSRLLTRNDVTRIHWIVVLEETKAVHEFDLSNVSSSMAFEVLLDVFLGDWAMDRMSAAVQHTKLSAVP